MGSTAPARFRPGHGGRRDGGHRPAAPRRPSWRAFCLPVSRARDDIADVDRGGIDEGRVAVSEVLLVVLVVLVLVAVVAAVIAVRRRPDGPVLDEATLRRLLRETTVDRPAGGAHRQSSASTPLPAVPAASADPEEQNSVGRAYGLLSTEATAASEAADAVRRAATEAAEELRRQTRQDAEQIRADARADAERTLAAARQRAAELAAQAQEQVELGRVKATQEAVASVAADRREVQDLERKVRAAGDALTQEQQALAAERRRLGDDHQSLESTRTDLQRRVDDVEQERAALDAQAAELAHRAEELARRAAEVDAAIAAQQQELSRIAGLTAEDARAELLSSQEEVVRRDSALMIRRVEADAQRTAKQRARAIVADAIQRVASDQTAQTVVAVLHLPADDVKGRIIGREGRNIRAFETITGVNVIIDDTPEAVLLSCFDPVRREIGRITLQTLIDDGRIHPHRIEEAYERARDEVEVLCQRAAEDALLAVRITDLHPELVSLVGRLKYRTSYGQNVLGHLVETAHIARGMAAELGIDPTVVNRGAFLHDIGKALTHEAQGSHAIVGAELARRFGESEAVAHCIEAHHDEVAPSTVEAVLTQAADSCSGGRPGARRESLESYVQRLEQIEAIAASKRGVDKVFAMQAGRELRVMVKPDVVDDLAAHVLAREVAKQIEEELTYPGQVRVTVIRESRATEIAR
ncbi:ribonuclease Y [Nakamurella flava]|uniref:Ribonuclease Y n=1 Tax=Nakamurella flava TaxID=2576308 RepID=A0A4U6Q7T4_9ACTN|nr:ribonuclease Y [Nakamurella flava]